MVGIVDVGRLVTSVGLAFALLLFAYMSIMWHNPDLPRWRSLKFGLSVVTIVWLIPESLPTYLPYFAGGDGGYGDASSGFGVGAFIHAAAMAVFSLYILVKARVFARG